MLAAAASALGEIEEARQVVAQCVTRWPEICLGNIMPIYIPHLTREEDRKRLCTALHQVGFPE
jgi:hypothetical protein